MKAQQLLSRVSLGLLFLLVLTAGCATPTQTPAPTTDINPIRTEVAATVYAQVTQALVSTPSATLAASATPTLLPSSTPMVTASLTPTVTVGTRPTGTGTSTPTLTDLAQFVSQSIPDDTIFAPSQTFTMTWTLKNVGTSTWKATYLLRYYSGSTFSAPKEKTLGKEVPPGGTVAISLKMVSPPTPGTYVTTWVMANQFRSNFKEPVYLRIIVGATVTPSP